MSRSAEIWLVDANTYERPIDPRLLRQKEKYFRVKALQRARLFGVHRRPTGRTFSVGLLRLATLIRGIGRGVRYLNIEDLRVAFERCGDDVPDVVAFGAVTPMVDQCAALASQIKSERPLVRTVLGGAHSNQARQLTCSRYPMFDSIIAGREDIACAGILGVPTTALKPTIHYCDYDLLPLPLVHYDLNTFTAAGCIYRCDYCQDKSVPYLEVDVADQVERLAHIMPARSLLHFFDSVFGYTPARAKDQCRKLAELGHPFILSCDMRAEWIKPEFVRALCAAGIREIRMGIESYDVNLLHLNRRTLMPQRLEHALRVLREHSNIYVALYSVNGLPGSTELSCRITEGAFANLLGTMRVDEIKMAQYVPYPADFVDYVARGVLLESHDWSRYDRQSFPVYRLPTLTSADIWERFVSTSETIAEEWAAGLGVSNAAQLPTEGYPEYHAQNYAVPNGSGSGI